MGNTQVWLYASLAAAAGVLTAVWGHVRGVWSQCYARIVVHGSTSGLAASALQAYLSATYAPSRFNRWRYMGVTLFVRPLDRVATVFLKAPGASGAVFWRGWTPVWLGIPNKDEYGQTMGHDPPYYQVSGFRWLTNIDQLMLDVVEWWNVQPEHERQRGHRFRVIHCHGSADSQISFDSDRGPRTQGDDDDNALVSLYGLYRGARLLKWTPEQIGAKRRAQYDPVKELVLPAAVEAAVDDLKRWLKSRDWYSSNHLPWKSGWLLHGPPGTGKTALARGLGQMLDLPIFVFDLSTYRNHELRKDWMQMASETPCIALIEDIDATFDGRKSIGKSLTFDALLNVMEGVTQIEGVFVMLTTNDVHKVDEALGGGGTTRPGRVDRVLEMPLLDKDGQRRLAERLLKDHVDLQYEVRAQSPQLVSGAVFQDMCAQRALERFWQPQSQSQRSKYDLREPTST